MAGYEKIILAYSGGLDTTVAIPWLKEKLGADIVAVLIDAGHAPDLEEAKNRALVAGAQHAEVVDAKERFADRYLSKALKANALYQNRYPLVSALSRPLISEVLVDVAISSGAKTIAHGCTGKGNDQVRFTLSLTALNPTLNILAPARDWDMSREEAIAYAEERKIKVPITKKSPYSIDQNLWGRTAECGALEDPTLEPPTDAYEWSVNPVDAPNEPEYVDIDFKNGLPVALNGKEASFISIIEALNVLGGKHGSGRIDMIEDRLVGIKSREIYECPASLALIEAHRQLEDLTLDKDTLAMKKGLEQRWSELVYNGLWFSPLKTAIDEFIESTQNYVSGNVRLKYYKGNCIVVGRSSDNSLYDYALATYDKSDSFSHKDAAGFIELWGLPLKIWAKKHLGE